MSLDFLQGIKIAEEFSVQTDKDCAVLYSISYLPSTQNRDNAYAYVKAHPNTKTLDDTPCGKELCKRGYAATMDIAPDELKKIWHIASLRFINQASGNITAFVEGADKRSTFCSTEAPAVLKNDKIKTINKTDKFLFLKDYIKG